MEALATAAVQMLLKFLTSQSINTLLALCALVCLLAWLVTGLHTGVTVVSILGWAGHLAVMLIIDIAKGGAGL